MLTPEQVAAIRDQANELTKPITDYLLQDIARRISEAGQLTSSASYQIYRAQQLGLSRKEIEKELKRLLKVGEGELKTLLTQSAEVGYRFDLSNFGEDAVPFEENEVIQQIVGASVQLATDDFKNITQTLGMVDPYGNVQPLHDAYQKCMDFAYSQVATEATDYNTAIRNAVKNLSKYGVRSIDYESGVHRSLEAATRGCVMGGLGLMQEQISQQNHDDMGADGWEISAHAASAPDHEPIQGKQYSDKEYTALNNSLIRRIGTLNCGHAAYPIIMGVSDPQYSEEELEEFRQQNEEGITFEGKHYTMYEATQTQRRLERAMRSQKRKILVDEAIKDDERLLYDQIRLRRINEEYVRFSRAADLPLQRERAQVAGFTRKHSDNAKKAVSIYNSLAKTRDQARFKESIYIVPPPKGDAITHDSLYKNLNKSIVGRETIEYIQSGKSNIEISYSPEVPQNLYGECVGKSIYIYAKNTRTIKQTAKTLVHEITHAKYRIGGSQHAEVVCFAREILHEKGSLTIQDIRSIIKNVKELYPEYPWRKGGIIGGKNKSKRYY